MSDNGHDEKKIPLPLGILVSEFLGSGLMALGVAKQLGGMDLLPAVTQFDQSGWWLIGLGFLFTLPFLLYIIIKVREKAKRLTN